MRYIKFYFDIGYYTGYDEIYESYPEDTPDAYIENEGDILFYEHCEDFSHLIMSDFDEESNEDYIEQYQNYIDDYCSWGWEEISQEEYLEWIKNE